MIDSEPKDSLSLFEQFVLPLYYFDHNRKPKKWATGFIVEIKKQHFLVTAAHVRLSHKEAKGPLYFFHEHRRTIEIGNMTMTNLNPDTGIDRWDLAIAKLPDGGGPPYAEVNKRAVHFDQLTPSLVPRSDWNYAAVGFPNSKNKVYEREIKGRALAVISGSPSQDVYDSMELNEQQHILVEYDRTFESKGAIFPKLTGMSGGPIFAFLGQEEPTNIAEVKVVAVATDYIESKKLIKGTDVVSLRFMIENSYTSNKK